MVLLTNGCSWTWGGGIFNHSGTASEEKRLESVWPHYLGKHLSCTKVYNLSIGCGSNDRILRTTFDWLLHQDEYTLSNTVAVIQWTEPSRYEFYVQHDKNNLVENIPDRWVRCKTDCVVFRSGIGISGGIEYQTDITNKFLSNWTDIQSSYKLLFQVEALSNLFNSYNVKYFYWSNNDHILRSPQKIKERLNHYIWLDFFDNEQWTYERISDTDDHPSFNGHIEIAEIINNRLKGRI